MCVRTSRRVVTFTCPFSLSGVEGIQPPGTYVIETDEERIEGLSFPAYRRIATVMELRSKPCRPGVTEVATIDPLEVEMALERDVVSTARLTPEPLLGELFEDEVLQQAVRSSRLTMAEFKETLLAPAARIRHPQPS